MKISIALCTYNGEKYLAEQLESLLAQTRPPDEIVVCDDCSIDSTVGIIESFAARASFPVRLRRNSRNLRSTANFAQAIELCAGDIIAPCDQDDVWRRDKLEIFADVFTRRPNVGLAFCDAELVDEKLEPLGCGNWDLLGFDTEKQREFIGGASLEHLLKGAYVWGCMMAFRASYKNLVLPIPETLPGIIHDSWAAILIAAVAAIEPIPQRLVKYRQHTAQQLGQQAADEMNFVENIGKKYNYDEEITRLDGVRQRLEDVAAPFPAAEALKIINSRLHHFEQRREIERGGARKLRLVARELFSRRYHRHTSGFKSAIKDLFTA